MQVPRCKFPTPLPRRKRQAGAAHRHYGATAAFAGGGSTKFETNKRQPDMKKRHSIHVLLAAAALLLVTAACTKDELADGDRLPEGQYPVEIARITLGVEGGEAQPWGAPQTRVSENGDGRGSVFDASDEFSVQIDGDTQTGTYAVQEGGSAKAIEGLSWKDKDTHTVHAWYPAGDGTLDLSNQSQNLAYLLSGTGTGDYQNPVALTFTHALAKVRVTPSTEVLSEVTSLQLYTYTQCTYEKGTVVQGSQEGWIEMKQCSYNGTTCWEANVVPGCEITKLMANDTEERALSAAIIPEAGKFYDITLKKDDPGYTEVSEGEYTVDNEKGLKNLAELVNNGENNINITLTGDIDLSDIDWTPIGIDRNHPYTGTFDGGNYHAITGLTVTGSNEYAGLFGYIGSGGTVQNVVLESVDINNNNPFGSVGGVAGCNEGTIENCSFSGNVYSTGLSNTGGITGENRSEISGCSAEGTVESTGTNVGGIAGTFSAGTIEGCHSTADVSGGSSVGGVVGNLGINCRLIASYSTGDVTSTTTAGSANTGGVVGLITQGTVTGCYHATGQISSPVGNGMGGIVGYSPTTAGLTTLTACYWDNNLDNGIGQIASGGLETDRVEKVTDDNWKNARDEMNDALISANSEWRYGLNNEGLPELTQ